MNKVDHLIGDVPQAKGHGDQLILVQRVAGSSQDNFCFASMA